MKLLAALLLLVQVTLAQPGCQTQTQSNPIADWYPMNITGVFNGTFSIAFVNRQAAESILPQGVSFLDDVYRREVAGWREDMFPVLIRAGYVHDIRARDRMVRNHRGIISFELPFVDALGDGKTPFRYAYTQLIQAMRPSYGLDIAEQYGVPHIIPSNFDPECDAYGFIQGPDGRPHPAKLRGMPARTPRLTVEVTSPQQLTKEARPVGDDELKRIVNQPRFGIGKEGMVCGRRTTMFGEEVGFDELVRTKGEVSLNAPFESLDFLFEEGSTRRKLIYGIRVGTAFVDRDFVDCQSLAN
ncbi:hypothetical protein ACRALDRAFT_1074343 [Sodiomyces alcalophilus JCM 7366]|uniref:uncharacterized protein n=1 Tax=Sodiomyces alcalophilus JCM 7366 TaxID=591952 RepID=UPI0039B3A3C8